MVKSTRILIVGGAGTFGLSTAWHLAKKGYASVTVLDREEVPCRWSAGWDISKIARTEYTDPLYTRLAHEALDAWRSPPFSTTSPPLFHQTGWLYLKPPNIPAEEEAEFKRSVELTRKVGDGSLIEELNSGDEIKKRFSMISGELEGWSGIYNGNAGWVEAKKALQTLGSECIKLGVTFVSGASGTMVSLIRSASTNEVVGVKAEDGTEHFGDKIVLATGAWSETLLDFEGQLFSGCYHLCHIKLSEEERKKYDAMPVIDATTVGYCFPPTPDGIYKIASLGNTQRHLVPSPLPLDPNRKVSVPLPPMDNVLAEENVEKCRNIARSCLPELGDRELSYKAMCWDTESFDLGWILSKHPSSSEHLFIATAGSGHSFKNLPILGKYTTALLEGTLSSELEDTWRWRPEKVKDYPQPKRVRVDDRGEIVH